MYFRKRRQISPKTLISIRRKEKNSIAEGYVIYRNTPCAIAVVLLTKRIVATRFSILIHHTRENNDITANNDDDEKEQMFPLAKLQKWTTHELIF